MIISLITTLNWLFGRLHRPSKKPPKRHSRVAKYLLLGTFVEAVGSSPLETTDFPISDPLAQWEWAPANLMDILVKIQEMLLAAWDTVEEAANAKLPEVNGNFHKEGTTKDVNVSLLPHDTRAYRKLVIQFKERIEEAYKGGGLDLADFRPIPTKMGVLDVSNFPTPAESVW